MSLVDNTRDTSHNNATNLQNETQNSRFKLRQTYGNQLKTLRQRRIKPYTQIMQLNCNMVQTSAPENHLKYINTIICGQHVKGTLDGGSQVTIVDYRTTPTFLPIHKETSLKLTSASGHNIPIVGKVYLPIQFGKLRTRLEAIVVKNFECPLLLSIAFFNQLKAKVDHGTNKIELEEEGVQSGPLDMFYITQNANKSYNITQQNTAKPWTEHLYGTKYEQKIFKLEKDQILEPDEIQYWKINWNHPGIAWNTAIMNSRVLKIIAKDARGIFVQNKSGQYIRVYSDSFLANTRTMVKNETEIMYKEQSEPAINNKYRSDWGTRETLQQILDNENKNNLCSHNKKVSKSEPSHRPVQQQNQSVPSDTPSDSDVPCPERQKAILKGDKREKERLLLTKEQIQANKEFRQFQSEQIQRQNYIRNEQDRKSTAVGTQVELVYQDEPESWTPCTGPDQPGVRNPLREQELLFSDKFYNDMADDMCYPHGVKVMKIKASKLMTIEPGAVLQIKLPSNDSTYSLNEKLFRQKKLQAIKKCKRVLSVRNSSAEIQHIYPNTTMVYQFTNHRQARLDGFDEEQIAEIKKQQRILAFNVNDFQINQDMTKHERRKIRALLLEFACIFSMTNNLLHYVPNVFCSWEMTDKKPAFTTPYRAPEKHIQIIKEMIEEMLENDIIEECMSEYNSPCMLVPKNVDTVYTDVEHISQKKKKSEIQSKKDARFIVDLRRVNEKIPKYSSQLGHIDDILQNLSSFKYSCVLDVSAAYNNMLVSEECRQYLAFSIPNDLQYRYKRLPFGLSCSPVLFMREMRKILGARLRLESKHVSLFMDDLICSDNTVDGMIHYMRLVFEKFAQHHLCIRPTKCKIGEYKYRILGYMITPDGITIDESKIAAITRLQAPKNKKELKMLIGRLNYHKAFAANWPDMIAPLNEMTKEKNEFKWTEEHQAKLDKIKQILASRPFLKPFDPNKEIILKTDASDNGVSGVMIQPDPETGDEHVVCFVGRALKDTERRWSVSEKEALGIVYTVLKLKHFLELTPFTVYTDHSALRQLNTITHNNSRLMKMALKLSPFQMTIKYIKGKENVIPDFYSRIATPKTEPEKVQDDILDEDILDLPGYDSDGTEIKYLNYIKCINKEHSYQTPIRTDSWVEHEINSILNEDSQKVFNHDSLKYESPSNEFRGDVIKNVLNYEQTSNICSNNFQNSYGPKTAHNLLSLAITRQQIERLKNADLCNKPETANTVSASPPQSPATLTKRKRGRPRKSAQKEEENNPSSEQLQASELVLETPDSLKLHLSSESETEKEPFLTNEKACSDSVVSDDNAYSCSSKDEAQTRLQTASKGNIQTPLRAFKAVELNILSLPTIREHQMKDEVYSKIITSLLQAKLSKITKGYYIYDNVLYRHLTKKDRIVNLIVIPVTLERHVLKMAHDAVTMGHPGVTKMYLFLKDRYYIVNLKRKVEDYISHCLSCAKFKIKPGAKEGYIKNIWPDVWQPFAFVSSDIIVGLPITKRKYRHIIVIVDHMTRYAFTKAIRKITAEETIQAFWDFIKIFSMPLYIHMDQGSNYTAKITEQFFDSFGAKCTFSTAFHHCSNQAEVLNKSLIHKIRNYTLEHPERWDEFLEPCTFGYNILPQENLLHSPFELSFGFSPRMIESIEHTIGESIEMPKFYERLQMMRQNVLENRELSLKYRKYYDDLKRAPPKEYKINSKVMLLTPVLIPGQSGHFSPIFRGPYVLIEQMDEHNYKIQTGHKKYQIVHRERLKACKKKMY